MTWQPNLDYLSDLCRPATVHAQLRSSVTLERSLSIPRTKTRTLCLRGFYFASSAAWNALPVHLRNPDFSLNSLKTKLKTQFFLDILTWLTSILLSLFVVRANVIVYKLARANLMSVLNWIELNWIELKSHTPRKCSQINLSGWCPSRRGRIYPP